MRKKLNPEHRSLSGVRVLVGRARHQAGALSTELRKRGAEVLEIPFIEIRKPKSFKPLDAALKTLGTYDWLILTSANGVEAMWARMQKTREGYGFGHAVRATRSRGTLAAKVPLLRIAAIGPATQKAIEQRGAKVDVVPKEYVAESVVKSLKSKVKGKRVLLVRAKVARDVIPHELRNAGAHVDVVEAYQTVVPQSSRARLRAALKNLKKRPHVVTFTSSSSVKNFAELLGLTKTSQHKNLAGIRMASIGPVTSATLCDLGLPVDIAAKEFTISGLVAAIVQSFATKTPRVSSASVSSVVQFPRPYSVTEQLQSAGTTCASRKSATRL
jgi:uroporphyrinogen-III synthase